jgi:NNP family nitrate/nitrite transporter-like MFS transporter
VTERGKAVSVLSANTLAFTVCFAVWMMNGVLITFLVDNKVISLDAAEVGWLLGIPVLTGSVIRLPVGMLTDRFGGRIVYAVVMLLSAAACFAMSYATTFWELMLGSLGFGLAGTAFAVGIAYTSVWFPQQQQGTALGIFGAGNAGSAVTSMGAPFLLQWFTDSGKDLEGWRTLPRVYAASLLVMTVIFWFMTFHKVTPHARGKTWRQLLGPLKEVRVWRFGLYYFFVFGCFVALAQWLIPYYVNVYAVSVAVAGLLSAIFSLPSGVIRAFGGWLSDKFGARTVMYWVLGSSVICCLLLVFPRMDVTSPGEGVIAAAPGVVSAVTATEIQVGERRYALRPRPAEEKQDESALVWPQSRFWQEPAVKPGDRVVKKQLLARGVTHIYFQANIWVFTALVFIVGIAMGIGKAAVYKYIPEYFPESVGVVGGVVGVIGGLGGFFGPIVFGYLLRETGLWTTSWMFLFALALICLIWMHIVVRRITRERAPHIAEKFEAPHAHAPAPVAVAAQAGAQAAGGKG